MNTRIAPFLLGLCLAFPGDIGAQSALQPEGGGAIDRQSLRSEIRAYLLENPEVIIEALQILEERRETEAARSDKELVAAHAEGIFNDAHSHVGGNPEGALTLVEFLDYRCHYCKQVHSQIAELLARNPDIRLIVKEFPILGPESVAIGRMAVAAAALDGGKYDALNDALMTFPGDLTEDAAYVIAAETGYDADALRVEASDDATAEKLQANYLLAQALGLNGTPSFVLEDEIIRGFLPVEEFHARVAEKRRAADAGSQ